MAKGDDHKTALLSELDLHKTEFVALREEILQILDADRQYLNWTLAAIAGTLGISPLIVENNLYVVLLIVPFIFHVMLWEMLQSLNALARLGNYLNYQLIPRVNAILTEIDDSRADFTVLGWETEFYTQHRNRAARLVALSLRPTKQWIPVLAIGGSIITYGIILRRTSYSPANIELVLVLVNVILLVFAAIQNVFATLRGRTSPDKLQTQDARPPQTKKQGREAVSSDQKSS